jgi:hypothetical protein
MLTCIWNTIYHAIDLVFRPNNTLDFGTTCKEPITVSKLNKGDALRTTQKVMLRWIIKTVAETLELLDHHAHQLLLLLDNLLALWRILIKQWQKFLGKLCSMALGNSPADNCIYLNQPIHDALLDLQSLAQNLDVCPTCIGELVDTLPVAYGMVDTCGVGMGGIWLQIWNWNWQHR